MTETKIEIKRIRNHSAEITFFFSLFFAQKLINAVNSVRLTGQSEVYRSILFANLLPFDFSSATRAFEF